VSGGRWRCKSCVVGVCGAVVVVVVAVVSGGERVWVEESKNGAVSDLNEGESGEGERDPGVGGRERCVRFVVVLCTAIAGKGIFA
jgi:hypothetical protein